MEVKDLLKAMRKEVNMTQRQFSAYFGIPLRTVEDWERGLKHMPDYVMRLFVYKLRVEGLIGNHPDWEDFHMESRRIRTKKKSDSGEVR